MSRLPASVLAGIPGWEHASVRELTGGLSNRTWLVQARGRKAVLKIDESPRAAPFNTREREAQIQTVAAEQGLANYVLHVTDTVYLTEYIEGDVWTRSHFDDDEQLEQLARALRRLHSLPLTGRTFDARHAARQYAEVISHADPELLSKNLRVVEEMPTPRQLACCHNDLVAENILAVPGIRFLDWEYACDNDPLFDLATIVAHHDLSEDSRTFLLDTYFDGDGARYVKNLRAYERLYRALLWLWNATRGSERGICRPK